MSLIQIPNEFYSSIYPHKFMTRAYAAPSGLTCDLSDTAGNLYGYTYLANLTNQIEEFCAQLISYPEFLQAVLGNNQKLLDEKKYTLEHLKNTEWKGYFDRDTILNIAIQKGRIDLAKRFINEGAPIGAKEYTKDPYQHPIFNAIEGDYLDIVNLLCQKDPELINISNFSGLKPLHVAAIKGKDAIVEVLIANGADLYARTPCGDSVLMCAILDKHTQLTLKLLEREPELANGINSKYNHTPLYLVASNNMLDVAKRIVEISLRHLEVADDIGRTPLHAAVQFSNLKMVDLLIQHGANVNTKDKNGETLFHTFIRKSDNEKILQLLIDAGASVLEKNNDGITPIQLAHQLGRLHTKKLLQEYLVKSTEENKLEEQANEIEHRYFQEKEQQERIKQQEEAQKEILKMQKQILAQLDNQRKDIEELKKQGSKNEHASDSISQKLKKIKTTINELQEKNKNEDKKPQGSFLSMFKS